MPQGGSVHDQAISESPRTSSSVRGIGWRTARPVTSMITTPTAPPAAGLRRLSAPIAAATTATANAA